MAHLLIVDDEQSICWGLSKLGEQLGHSVASASSAEQALRLAAARPPDAILLDVRLPGMTGLAAMPKLREIAGRAPIVVMTAYGDLETAVSAVRAGAFEYLVKPFDLRLAERVIEQALACRPRDEPPREPAAPSSLPSEIIGKSAVMQTVFRQVALVARSHVCVNLFGESGTGKELVARALHRYSDRASGPFVPVHIAALSPALAESELFGHMRGAFTGAVERRKGLFEQAHGGTLFLDEVADIPLAIQVKLLRALEYGEVWPVGADRPVSVDLRVVSATHQDLHERVARGAFRHDLLYRLASFQIRLPPLRERADDLEDLCRHFLDQIASRTGAPAPTLSAEAIAELKRRPWHGNIRELRSTLENAALVANAGIIHVQHLPAAMPAPPAIAETGGPRTPELSDLPELVRQWTLAELRKGDSPEGLHQKLLDAVEPALLATVLEHCRGQCSAAARWLGVHRVTLRKRLDQLGLAPDQE